MRVNLKSTLLAVLGIASLAVAVPMSIANAQDAGQRGGFAQRGDAQRGQFGAGAPQRGGDMQGMMQRMGGGGGTAMTQDNQFLYIVQGNQVYKLNKRDLSVVAAGRLPGGPRGPGGIDRPGQTDRAAGARRRGGGGTDIPPPGLPGDPIPPID